MEGPSVAFAAGASLLGRAGFGQETPERQGETGQEIGAVLVGLADNQRPMTLRAGEEAIDCHDTTKAIDNPVFADTVATVFVAFRLIVADKVAFARRDELD